MIIHTSLDDIPLMPEPIALAVGTFDGVHLGHQYLINELKKHGTPVVLTFSNHPAEILRPSEVPFPILTLAEKLQLLETFGVALTIVIPFTQELSQTPYDQFLKKIPFSTLVAGKDLCLGAKGEGTQAAIEALGYKTVCISRLLPLSSRLIREFIKNQKIDHAQTLLGHNKGSLWLDSRVEL